MLSVCAIFEWILNSVVVFAVLGVCFIRLF